MNKILVINYSQSGQLHQIIDNFLLPFEQSSSEIDRVVISPKQAFPFPWSSAVFFDAMPETVLEEPIELADYELKESRYDLIVLGYQPWFLSPSLPCTALLKDEKFRAVLKDTPVVTLIGARNMWLNSQLTVVREIEQAGGRMVANIPLIDRSPNLPSAISILYWMLTGKKKRPLGIFPMPGVSQRDIEEANLFGAPIALALKEKQYDNLQQKIMGLNKIGLSASILLIESRAKKLFQIWANLIKRKGSTAKKRAFWVSCFKYYLLIALFLISPIVLLIYFLLIFPFTFLRVARKKQEFYYLGMNPSTSD